MMLRRLGIHQSLEHIRPRHGDASVGPIAMPSFLSSTTRLASNLSSSALVATRATPIPTQSSPSSSQPNPYGRRNADRPRHVNRRHKHAPPRKACRSRRTRRAQPIAGLENSMLERNLSVYIEPIKPTFVRSFFFPSRKCVELHCPTSTNIGHLALL